MFELPPYPGRGIAVHRHHDGGLEWIYFLTGRSEASRRRVLHAEDDRVLVVPTDEAAAPDPLRHYACVRAVGQVLVVGNGDHVDQIADAFVPDAHRPAIELEDDDHSDATTLGDAARACEPEPDPPIRTPRIAVATRAGAHSAQGGWAIVHAWSVAFTPDELVRSTWTVQLELGEGFVLHTYGSGVDDVTSDATIHRFDAGGPGTDVAGRLWHALDPNLRVALAVGPVPSAIPERVLTERVG